MLVGQNGLVELLHHTGTTLAHKLLRCQLKNPPVLQTHASQAMLLHFPLPVKRAAAAVASRQGATGPAAATLTGLGAPLVCRGRLEGVVAWLELWGGLEVVPLALARGFEVG